MKTSRLLMAAMLAMLALTMHVRVADAQGRGKAFAYYHSERGAGVDTHRSQLGIEARIDGNSRDR
jgi:hypothetical protein